MIWLWVLGILLALILLLLLTRVGVRLTMHDGTLTVDVKVGLFRLRVLPAKKKKEKQQKTEKKPKKQAAPEKKETKTPKIAFVDIKDAILALWPPLKRALNRTRKGIRIHPLTVSEALGAANDPAAGAELYGYLHAGVWTVMPVLEQLLVIPEPSIHIGIDFDSPDMKTEGELGLSAQIGTLLGVALTIAIPALRWFLKWRKKQRRTPQTATEKQIAA